MKTERRTICHLALRTSFWLLASTVAVLAASCTKDMPEHSEPVSFRLLVPGQAAWDAESSINDLAAYRFEDGVLSEVALPEAAEAGGLYSLRFSDYSGEVYLLANIAGDFVPGTTALEEFLDTGAEVQDMSAAGLAMTGHVPAAELPGAVSELAMHRSVARLDIRSLDKNVEVLRVSVDGLAAEGKVFPSELPGTPGRTEEFVKDYSSQPLANASERLLYMAEQRGGQPVEVLISENGGLVRLRTELPGRIDRNTIYTLEIAGNGAGVSVLASEGDWESGSPGTSLPDCGALVDAERSLLPEGVSLNEAGDAVRVSAELCEFELVLLGRPGSSVEQEGRAQGVTLEVLPVLRAALEERAAVRVKCDRRGAEGIETIYLNLVGDGVNSGRIRLEFGPGSTE